MSIYDPFNVHNDMVSCDTPLPVSLPSLLDFLNLGNLPPTSILILGLIFGIILGYLLTRYL